MNKLPPRFPEYSIMYKTLVKQVKELEKTRVNSKDSRKQECFIKNKRIVGRVEKDKREIPRRVF